MKEKIEAFLDEVRKRNGHETEFLQAVEEVAETVIPCIAKHDIYNGKNILLRMVEPERLISFRVCWVDDSGELHVNRGYRIQMNSAIGPYKGGLRFHPSVNASILKFLAFEQVFKNALTTLPMGGGKGGSDFDPKGKSDNEAKEIIEDFLGMIKENPDLKSNLLKEDDKTKLMCLSGVKQYPMRVKCATLSWHTLVSAMEEDGKQISTED